MQRELAQLQGRFAALAGTMEAARRASSGQGRNDLYRNQMTALKDLQELYRLNATASGKFHTETVRGISASQALTESIVKQKLGWKQLRQEMGAYKASSRGAGTSALREAIREQTALRQAMSTQFTGTPFGRNTSEVFIPRNLGPELENARIKYGMINQMIRSAATQTVNWGKNTQWAGRQIMVGITVPLMLAAAGSAMLAYKVDQNMTRIAKVYDTVNKTAAGKERELADLRERSLKNSTRLANDYGAAVAASLDVEAQLAATGLSGSDLFASTTEAIRIATLGEMDYQKSVDMTISLQTAFKLSTEELTDAFNFMNSVENATSLSIQDIAEATPRAASAMSALGVTVQQMTTLLVAMKESGVDAAEAANALKSGTSAILDPSREAIAYWKDSLGMDLPQIVKDAKGNMYEFIKSVSLALRGLDPQTVQTAISKTFGRYQFNRQAALFQNMGDAMAGVANQTKKSMDLSAESTSHWANTAEEELERWQKSVSGRFKRTLEGLKAALVPFGTVVLSAVEPIMRGIKAIIDGFNNLGSTTQHIVLWTLAIIGVVGPVLMLIGIFANLFGSILKLGSWLYTLRNRFRVLTVEQQAMALNSRTARSGFDTQAASAANLATQITALTTAMERQAVAAGLMMSSTGKMANMNAAGAAIAGSFRQVERNAAGQLVYGSGSRANPNTGGGTPGRQASAADQRAYQEMERRSGVIATNTERTRMGWGKIAGIMMALPLVFMAMSSGSSEVANTWVNILMIVGMIALMAPGLFMAPLRAVGSMLVALKAMGSAGVMGRMVLGYSVLATTFTRARVAGAGITRSLASSGGALLSMMPKALKIFGAVGILAGGAMIIKDIVDDLHEAERTQETLAGSGEAWADALGYSYNPGQLPGMDEGDVSELGKRAKIIKDMTAANEDLGEAMAESGRQGRAWSAALNMALESITSGGSVEHARELMGAALQMAGMDPLEISPLLIKFDEIQLENPEQIFDAIADQIKSESGAIVELDLQGSQPISEGLLDYLWSEASVKFGGDLSDEARARMGDIGQLLAEGLNSATDRNQKIELFTALRESLNQNFEDMYNDVSRGNVRMREAMDKFQIDNADELMKKMSEIDYKLRNQIDLSTWEDDLFKSVRGPEWEKLKGAYSEALDSLVQGMVDHGFTQEAADELRAKFESIWEFRETQVGPGMAVPGIISVTDAMKGYGNAVEHAFVTGHPMTKQQELIALNAWRAKAGLEAVTDATIGFSDAAGGAADGLSELARAEAEVERTSEMYLQQIRSTMEGTMGDVYQEADRRLQAHQDAELDSIRQRGEDQQQGYENEQKNQDAHFDQLGEAQSEYWENAVEAQSDAFDQQQDNMESFYDGRVSDLEDQRDAMGDAYDAQIEAIQDTMDAEQKAEDERQRIFEAQKTRISRLAEMANASIDFNVALNSGNLDEAAKLSNDASAKAQQWSMDDSQQTLEEQAAKRREGQESEIERLQAEKESKTDAFNTEIDQIKTAKDAALSALKERQEAEREALEDQRQLDEKRLKSARDTANADLDARKEANRKSTEDAVANAQAQFEADRRGLAARLRELQAFTPRNQKELDDHIKKVEAAYAEYGVDLTAMGGGWSQFIGDSLKSNVTTAGNALQNDVNWQALGKVISDRISGSMGVSSGDLAFFLKNGRFPRTGILERITDQATAFAQGIDLSRHEGGYVYHGGGGPGYSQKDRTGVPRSASTYPSEVHALLKRGEFVVEKTAAHKNREVLEAMNAGAVVRHSGGMIAAGPNIANTWGTLLGAATEKAVGEYAMASLLAQRAAEAAALSGSSGAIEPGDTVYGRLFNTVKRQFPRANLNSGLRSGDPGYHGKGMAVDLGEAGFAGGLGRPYLAAMNRWIYDNFRGSTELIYDGLGDDRPDLFRGQNHTYNSSTQAQHRNHVHWAMTPEAIAASGRGISAAPGGDAAAPTNVTGNQAIVKNLAASMYGWVGAQWDALYKLVMKESGFRNTAQNPTSTAYGMFQFLNSTWAGTGYAKTSDPTTQTKAGLKYISGRYGTPSNALAFHLRNNWYDDGGFLPPGLTMAMNATGRPEPVFTSDQWDLIKNSLANSTIAMESAQAIRSMTPVANASVDSGGNTSYDITIDLRGAYIKEEIDLERAVQKVLDDRESRNGRRKVIR